jgi:hypothetical protein
MTIDLGAVSVYGLSPADAQAVAARLPAVLGTATSEAVGKAIAEVLGRMTFEVFAAGLTVALGQQPATSESVVVEE